MRSTPALTIALVSETFPPDVNGVARTLWQLAAGLARRGHRLEVLRPDPKAADQRPPEGWQDVRMPGLPIPFYRHLRFGLPAAGRLLRRWRDPGARPDVVHVATEGPLGWSALWAARRLGIPVSTTFHTNFHDYSHYYGFGLANRICSRYLRWFHNRAGCTLVPTADVRRDLERLGFERVGVIARGVDTGLFHPGRRDPELRRSWGAGDDDLVVAFISRLAEEKNLGLVASAFDRVQTLRPNARLVVVGDGPARAQLAARVPAARFCGMKKGAELAACYASADLFLFPSLTETFGNVLLEAMASGLATVAFDYAAAALLVRQGIEGFKAPRGDEPAFLAEVEAAVTRPVPELREMGKRAAEVAARQTWERIVEKFEAELLTLLRDSSGTSAARNRPGLVVSDPH